jgi:hypothetical protein
MFATTEVNEAVRWLSATADLNIPEEVIEDTEDRKVITRYTPLGVVGAIVPWNFPIQLGKRALPLPILQGNNAKSNVIFSLREDWSRSSDRKLHHHQAIVSTRSRFRQSQILTKLSQAIHAIFRSQAR